MYRISSWIRTWVGEYFWNNIDRKVLVTMGLFKEQNDERSSVRKFRYRGRYASQGKKLQVRCCRCHQRVHKKRRNNGMFCGSYLQVSFANWYNWVVIFDTMDCWWNCNFGMYSLVFLMYCNPMFILRCTWVVSCLDVPIRRFYNVNKSCQFIVGNPPIDWGLKSP